MVAVTIGDGIGPGGDAPDLVKDTFCADPASGVHNLQHRMIGPRKAMGHTDPHAISAVSSLQAHILGSAQDAVMDLPTWPNIFPSITARAHDENDGLLHQHFPHVRQLFHRLL